MVGHLMTGMDKGSYVGHVDMSVAEPHGPMALLGDFSGTFRKIIT